MRGRANTQFRMNAPASPSRSSRRAAQTRFLLPRVEHLAGSTLCGAARPFHLNRRGARGGHGLSSLGRRYLFVRGGNVAVTRQQQGGLTHAD